MNYGGWRLQRFSVWLTRLTSATHNAYSERLRQAFMKPWFAWVNIIVNRYRSPARLTYPPHPRLLDVLQSAGRAQADRRRRIVIRYLHLISSHSVHCRGPLFGPQKNNGVPRPAALRRWGGAERRYAQARSLSTSEPHGSPSLPYLSHKRYATTPRKKPLRPPR